MSWIGEDRVWCELVNRAVYVLWLVLSFLLYVHLQQVFRSFLPARCYASLGTSDGPVFVSVSDLGHDDSAIGIVAVIIIIISSSSSSVMIVISTTCW